MAEPASIERAFDGSTPGFRALAAFGWGELLNLGYIRLADLPRLLSGSHHFQRLLARRSIALLEPGPGDVVVDVACGLGWTSRQMADAGARVVGVDLVPRHVERARERHAGAARLSFLVGDAAKLAAVAGEAGLAEGSVSGILCLEAAFHFGPEGRRSFLDEAFRLLAPRGRLVLVDFAWRGDRPEEIEALDAERRVREMWQFEQFEPLASYRTLAASLGFHERALHDWSRQVIDRFQRIGDLIVALGRRAPTRRLLIALRPGLGALSEADWRSLAALMAAHDRVRRHTRYVALVWERPAEEPGSLP